MPKKKKLRPYNQALEHHIPDDNDIVELDKKMYAIIKRYNPHYSIRHHLYHTSDIIKSMHEEIEVLEEIIKKIESRNP